MSTFVFLLLSISWFIANAFTGEGVNGAVFYHLRTGFGGAGLREYATLISAFALAVACAAALAVLVYRRKPGKPTGSMSWQSALLTVALPILCFMHPTVNATLRDFNYALYGSESLMDSALGNEEAAEPFESHYIQQEPEWQSPPRRNLVVIYAESLEQTYFDEKLFPGLITELRELQDQATSFSNIRSVEGTGFTIAGLVASQCGLPLITTGHPNSMRGMDRFLSGATCIGDLLKAQEYRLHYLGGADLSFAGKGSFLKTHGFDSVMGRQELEPLLDDPSYVSTWGLYDDFLLEQFLGRFEKLSGEDQPFGLFGLTMDTHHPSGHRSRSCEGLEYADGRNRMLNAVHCADHLLATTLKAILASPAADNTLVVLASDHLALKNDAYDLLTQGKRRNLLWLFSPDSEPKNYRQPGTTMDTSVALLRGLGADVEAFALGRNISQPKTSLFATLPEVNSQLRKWRGDFAKLWDLPEQIEALSLNSQKRTVEINDRQFQAPALIALNDGKMESIRFEFDSRQNLYQYVQDMTPDTPFVWFDECSKVRALELKLPVAGLCFFAGRTEGRRVLAGVVTDTEELDAGDLRSISGGFTTEDQNKQRRQRLATLAEYGVADLRQSSIQTSLLNLGAKLNVRSSGGPKSRSLLETASHKDIMERGIQLFALTDSGTAELIAHYDLCQKNSSPSKTPREIIQSRSTDSGSTDSGSTDSGSTDSGSTHIESTENAGSAYLLVAHDSPTCGASLKPLLGGLPLTDWKDLGFRQPYVALFSPDKTGESVEVIGDRYSQLRVTFSGTELVAAVHQ
ncbi:sulfatase-like hydrolase/transferase [Congregibacter sp.]|uniref:sulfatase-like hydrolase/transferase n=1 Tax=Congregibacter sp. TaxID=2744308 RepID=UPI003859D2D3